MATDFHQTMRAVQEDQPRGWAWLVTALVLGGWLFWMVEARITVYALSATARISAAGEARAAECAVQGRIAHKHVVLGQRVKTGDLLVQLDSATDRRRLEVEQQRLLSLQPQVVALTRELAATEEAARQAARTTTVLLDQHRSREVAAEVAARVSGEEAKRLAELHGQGAAPLMEVQRTRVEAESRKANLAVEGLESRRLLSEQLGREGQTRAHQEELRRELALLQGTVATTTATIRVLEEELLKLEVRAPVDGEVAHVTPLTVGSVVQAGHAVARIVPQGDLVVIAEFEPGQALGRVREGQPARMRLDAFPWTQFGSLPVHVRTVASETAQARGGRVRVEFAIDADAPSVLPLQHGLPGSVEVALEEVSPWVLMLRATGEFLRADTRSTPAPLEAPRLEQH